MALSLPLLLARAKPEAPTVAVPRDDSCLVREIYEATELPAGAMGLTLFGTAEPVSAVLQPTRPASGVYDVTLKRVGGSLYRLNRGALYVEMPACVYGPSPLSNDGVLRVGTANPGLGKASILFRR